MSNAFLSYAMLSLELISQMPCSNLLLCYVFLCLISTSLLLSLNIHSLWVMTWWFMSSAVNGPLSINLPKDFCLNQSQKSVVSKNFVFTFWRLVVQSGSWRDSSSSHLLLINRWVSFRLRGLLNSNCFRIIRLDLAIAMFLIKIVLYICLSCENVFQSTAAMISNVCWFHCFL